MDLEIWKLGNLEIQVQELTQISKSPNYKISKFY